MSQLTESTAIRKLAERLAQYAHEMRGKPQIIPGFSATLQDFKETAQTADTPIAALAALSLGLLLLVQSRNANLQPTRETEELFEQITAALRGVGARQ
jgi:hypothetical protein